MKINQLVVDEWKKVHDIKSFAIFVGRLFTYVVTFGNFGFPRAKSSETLEVKEVRLEEREVTRAEEGEEKSEETIEINLKLKEKLDNWRHQWGEGFVDAKKAQAIKEEAQALIDECDNFIRHDKYDNGTSIPMLIEIWFFLFRFVKKFETKINNQEIKMEGLYSTIKDVQERTPKDQEPPPYEMTKPKIIGMLAEREKELSGK